MLFAAALLPLALLVIGVTRHTLGANPAEALIRSLASIAAMVWRHCCRALRIYFSTLDTETSICSAIAL